VAAGAAVFMFRKRIITGLLAATLGPRTTEPITAVVQATTEEHKVKKKKATGTKQKGQRSRTRPQKIEERTFDMEKLTKFIVSPQHSMGHGYARRTCDNCWDGKSTRDIDEGVLPTLCTGCETRKGPFASEQKQMEVWERARDGDSLATGAQTKELRKGDQKGEDVHWVLLQGRSGS
jgi:hypothetical protein